jgi:hypothetical protein
MEVSRFAKGILICAAISMILVTPVYAVDGALNLPSTVVRIEVNDGTQSYFDTKLTGVPSGYDVANGTYVGWCVDKRTEISYSPANHEVRLFSSIDPPAELADQR